MKFFDKSNLSLVKNNKFNYQFIRNNGKRENNEGNDTMGMQYRFWEYQTVNLVYQQINYKRQKRRGKGRKKEKTSTNCHA